MSFKSLILLPFLATPAFAGSLAPTPIEEAPAAPIVSVAPQTPSIDWSGASVGFQLGSGVADYDETDGAAVYGLRGTYDRDYGNWVAGGVLDYQGTDMDLGDGDDLDSMTKLGARLGYDRGANALYYGTGGYAHATTDDSDTSNGYYVGLGFETFVASNVTVNGEVSYNVFNDFEDSSRDLGATVATMGVNYRF